MSILMKCQKTTSKARARISLSLCDASFFFLNKPFSLIQRYVLECANFGLSNSFIANAYYLKSTYKLIDLMMKL